VQFDQRHQFGPGNHQFFQKLRPPRLFRVPLKPSGHRQLPVLESAFHLATI